VLQCVAVCCSVLQCAAVCCSVQRDAVCCSVLQRVAMTSATALMHKYSNLKVEIHVCVLQYVTL